MNHAARIMIVDDEEATLYAIKDVFQRNGIYALYFNDPLEYLNAIQDGVEVAVIDHYFKHSGLTGLNLLKRTKELWPDSRVILISVTKNSALITEYANSGQIERILPKMDGDFIFRLLFEVKRLVKEAEPKKKNKWLKGVFNVLWGLIKLKLNIKSD